MPAHVMVKMATGTRPHAELVLLALICDYLVLKKAYDTAAGSHKLLQMSQPTAATTTKTLPEFLERQDLASSKSSSLTNTQHSVVSS